MNAFEGITDIPNKLLKINAQAIEEIYQLDTIYARKYFELNKDYVQKMGHVLRQEGSFTDTQKEYGQLLWDGIQTSMKERGEILRNAVEESTDVIKGGFGNSDSP